MSRTTDANASPRRDPKYKPLLTCQSPGVFESLSNAEGTIENHG